MKPTFVIMFGRHTFKRSSTTIAAFVHQAGKQVGVRKFISNYFKVISTTRFPATIDMDNKDHGGWSQQVFDRPESYTVIGIQITKTIRGIISGACTRLIVLDPDAPFIQVTALPTPNKKAYCKKVPVFIGNGYVIDYKTAEGYGVKFTRNYIGAYLYDDEELDETFEVEVLKKSTSGSVSPPKPTKVKCGNGTKTVLMKDLPKRRVRVRK